MSIRNGIVAYKSPIETIWSDIEHECAEHFEQMVLIAVQSVGIRLNKEELIKALAYDRDQYRKGWEDRDSEIVRCKDCRYYDYPFLDSPSATSQESADAYPERWCCLLGMDGAFGKNDYCSHGERKTAESE